MSFKSKNIKPGESIIQCVAYNTDCLWLIELMKTVSGLQRNARNDGHVNVPESSN